MVLGSHCRSVLTAIAGTSVRACIAFFITGIPRLLSRISHRICLAFSDTSGFLRLTSLAVFLLVDYGESGRRGPAFLPSSLIRDAYRESGSRPGSHLVGLVPFDLGLALACGPRTRCWLFRLRPSTRGTLSGKWCVERVAWAPYSEGSHRHRQDPCFQELGK